MYKALMMLMYHGCLRVSEAVVTYQNSDHTLQVDSIKANYKQSHLNAYLNKFHSHKQQNNSNSVIKLQKSQVQGLCPVLSLNKYLCVRPCIRGFLFLDQ